MLFTNCFLRHKVRFLRSCHIYRGLGVAVTPHKTEGPSTSLTFLGIEIEMVVHLPLNKLVRLRKLIGVCQGKNAVTSTSSCPLLDCCNIPPKSGKTFLCQMIDLSMMAKKGHHWLRLNKAFQSDLRWWDVFLEDWNGVLAVS